MALSIASALPPARPHLRDGPVRPDLCRHPPRDRSLPDGAIAVLALRGPPDGDVRAAARSLGHRLTDPDESVALAAFHQALETVGDDPWPADWVGALLYVRAQADADREGEVWTPLLDAVAVADLWPTSRQAWAVATVEPDTARPATAFDRTADLASWLRGVRDPRRAEALLDDPEAPAVAQAMVRWGPIDGRLAHRLLDRGPRWLLTLADAHRIGRPSPRGARELAHRALAALQAGTGPVGDPGWEPPVPERQTPAAAALLRLAHRPSPGGLDASIRERLVALATGASGPRSEEEGADPAEQALRVLLGLPDLGAGVLERVARAGHEAPWVRVEILEHPDADAELFRWMARRHAGELAVERRLVGRLEAMADAEVRSLLATSEHPSVLTRVVDHGGPAGARAFERLLERSEGRALRLLRRGLPGSVLPHLDPESFAPILAHEDPEVRAAALAAPGRTDPVRGRGGGRGR